MSFTIYPALDLRAGNVVRLKTGDPAQQTFYSADPLQTARRWLDAGASWLHVVNLDGAFGENDAANQLALKALLKLGARIQFGGGLRSLGAIQKVIEMGASRVALGTLAIEQPEIIRRAIKKFGAKKIAVGIDARDGFVNVRGWQESSRVSAAELALRIRTWGVETAVFTDIRRDGLGGGLNVSATRTLAQASGLNLIASGGAQTLDDMIAVKNANLSGAIIGRALYEGTIRLEEALQIESP